MSNSRVGKLCGDLRSNRGMLSERDPIGGDFRDLTFIRRLQSQCKMGHRYRKHLLSLQNGYGPRILMLLDFVDTVLQVPVKAEVGLGGKSKPIIDSLRDKVTLLFIDLCRFAKITPKSSPTKDDMKLMKNQTPRYFRSERVKSMTMANLSQMLRTLCCPEAKSN